MNQTQSSGRAVFALNSPRQPFPQPHSSIAFLSQLHQVDFPCFSRPSFYRDVFSVLKDHGFSQKAEPRTHPRKWARQDQLTAVGAALPPTLPACSLPRDLRLPPLGPLTLFFSSPAEQNICELEKLPRLTLTLYSSALAC